MPRPSTPLMTVEQFSELVGRLPAAVVTGPREQLIAAARLVRDGVAIGAGDIPAVPALDPGRTVSFGVPAPFQLAQWTETAEGWTAVNDRLSIDIHGATSMTHIDTTKHFSWREDPDSRQIGDALIRLASKGLVSRGVLIDVEHIHGKPLGAGEVVTLSDVESFLQSTNTEFEPGDALYISFGRTEPADSGHSLGAGPIAGLSIECAEWMAAHRPGVVITDEGLDGFPSEVEGLTVPWHVLLLTVLDVPLVDRAMLRPLAEHCRNSDRWDFMSVIAPLPLPDASGSPVNPLAIF